MKNKILLLNKNKGSSSNYQLQLIKKTLSFDKVGFLGTLDPLAGGVLPLFTGKMTKLIKHIKEDSKIYKVKALVGIETDTLDICGQITNLHNRTKYTFISDKKNKEKIKSFEGEFEYIAPRYSALKLNGKRYYELAKNNSEFERKKIISRIHELDILNINPNSFELIVKCSPGTYVRSLVSSIGKSLGTFATVCKLERLKSGPFDIKDSVKVSDITNKKDIFYDPSKIFKRIQIDHKTLIKLKSLNNYKKIDLNHICENLYNRIHSVKDLKEDKIINIITGVNDKPELLIISFFSNDGYYKHSSLELLD